MAVRSRACALVADQHGKVTSHRGGVFLPRHRAGQISNFAISFIEETLGSDKAVKPTISTSHWIDYGCVTSKQPIIEQP
ncbi:hypothetical protein [Sphingomonas sp. PvP056]|uniref:hypothetical protein n=1 Tax=Sphingomonas sp. PvP056 TaxID=3156392 RepID=UPI003395ACC8